MEQNNKWSRKSIYFGSYLLVAVVGFILYMKYSPRFHPEQERTVYLIVDKSYKGSIMVYYSCKAGEQLQFRKGNYVYHMKDSVLHLKNKIDKFHVGIWDKDDLYDSKGNIKYLLDKNPRVKSVIKGDKNSECEGYVKLQIDSVIR